MIQTPNILGNLGFFIDFKQAQPIIVTILGLSRADRSSGLLLSDHRIGGIATDRRTRKLASGNEPPTLIITQGRRCKSDRLVGHQPPPLANNVHETSSERTKIVGHMTLLISPSPRRQSEYDSASFTSSVLDYQSGHGRRILNRCSSC